MYLVISRAHTPKLEAKLQTCVKRTIIIKITDAKIQKWRYQGFVNGIMIKYEMTEILNL